MFHKKTYGQYHSATSQKQVIFGHFSSILHFLDRFSSIKWCKIYISIGSNEHLESTQSHDKHIKPDFIFFENAYFSSIEASCQASIETSKYQPSEKVVKYNMHCFESLPNFPASTTSFRKT